MAQQLTVQSARWTNIIVILYCPTVRLPKVPRYLTMARTQTPQHWALEAFVLCDTLVVDGNMPEMTSRH